MVRLFVICFLMVVCASRISAQTEQQRLLKAVQQTRDTNKVLAYIQYGYWFEQTDLDSAAYYYKKAGTLSDKIHFTNGLLKYYANYTYVLNQQGKHRQSIRLNLEALQLAKQSKLPLAIADCLFNTGSAYNNNGQFEIAIRYYLKAAQQFEQLGREYDLSMVYDNIGGVFTNIGEYDKALPYNLKALRAARQSGDKLQLAKTLINRGITERMLHRLTESKQHTEAGLSVARAIHQPYLESIALNTLAGIQFEQHNPKSGLKNAHEALQIARTIDSHYSELEALKLLASGYLTIRETDSVVFYAQKSIDYGNRFGFKSDQQRLYEILSKGYALQGNYRGAHESLNRSIALKDSLSGIEINKKIRQLEAQYQHSKNRHHISRLEHEKTQQQFWISLLIFSLLVITLVAVLIYRNSREKKRLSEHLLFEQQQSLVQMEKEQQLIAAHSILQGQEKERSRLAQDLHDGLGGLLSGIKLTLHQKGDAHEQAQTQLDNAIQEMRRIAHSMMPESLVRFGLSEALSDFCSALSTTDRLTVFLQIFGIETRLDQQFEIAVYRMTQELINNAMKHGKASEIYVQLIRNEQQLAITVEDDGVGMNTQLPLSEKGMGLSSIQTRLSLLGGTIEVHSTPEVGTTVTLTIPIP